MLTLVKLKPTKGLSYLDKVACRKFCDVTGACIPGMEWTWVVPDEGEPYAIFFSTIRDHWCFRLSRSSCGWTVARVFEDGAEEAVSKGHASPRAALGGAGYWVICQWRDMVVRAEREMSWWWDAHRAVGEDEVKPLVASAIE